MRTPANSPVQPAHRDLVNISAALQSRAGGLDTGVIEAGRQIGRYKVVALLGRGGMGEVYRARDTRLQREVALKVLPPGLSDDAEALRRLELEARAASALNHPNIMTVYDLDRIGGISILVCELIDGESLRARMAFGALASEQAAAIARAIAQALGAAHTATLVHRDLKPENVMLTGDGRVKLLDFGIAKRFATAGGNITRPGDVIGTPRYLAPEQLREQPAEPSSDLFSLGVLLYEMLCGRHPFQRDTDVETATAILHDRPGEPPAPLDSMGTALLWVAHRCMDKRPPERPGGAPVIIALIDAITRAGSTSVDVDPASANRSRPVLIVLPLQDQFGSADNRHLSLGLAEAIVNELAGNRGLVVRPLRMLLRELEAGADPYELARRHGADAVVEGSFRRSGTRVRVNLQLLDLAQRRPTWSTKVDADIGDLFGLEDRVARCVAEAMRVELTPAPEASAQRAPAARAYELYLKGRLHLNHGQHEDAGAAIACFEAATNMDPGFAQGWAGLSEAYAHKAFNFESDQALYKKAQALCDKALSLDPDLPEIHHLRGRLCWCQANGFDHRLALEAVCLCLAGRPGVADAHHLAGLVLSHVGLIDSALGAFQAALRCNPDNHGSAVMVGYCHYLQGQWREVLDLSREAQHKLRHPWTTYQIGLSQVQLGDLDAVARTIEAGRREFPHSVLFDPLAALAAARDGRHQVALAHLETTTRNENIFGHYHHAQYDIACIQAALGDSAQAMAWLTAAAADGFPCGPFFARDPLLTALHGETGWSRLVQPCDPAVAEQAAIYDHLGHLSTHSSSRGVGA